MSFKPMLAAAADLTKLRFPLYASPKLDGIRAIVRDGKLLSRTLKPIPNCHIRKTLECSEFEGFDGELIIGDPTSKTVYQDTVSGVMSRDGEPDFKFFVFDSWRNSTAQYVSRWDPVWSVLGAQPKGSQVTPLVQHDIRSLTELMNIEERYVGIGYEGLILRDPKAPYKFGRSTVNEGYLLKLKRFEDSDAIVLDVIEEMANTNEAQKDELGRTKRSSAKAGKVGKGTMGALKVMDIHTGVEFECGAGFTAEQRAKFYTDPPKLIKYKFFPIGVKDKPRHPVFLGARDPSDVELSTAMRTRLRK
jgi:DNA ligase-1